MVAQERKSRNRSGFFNLSDFRELSFGSHYGPYLNKNSNKNAYLFSIEKMNFYSEDIFYGCLGYTVLLSEDQTERPRMKISE